MRPGTNQAKELKVRLDSQPGGARRTVGRKDDDCRLATPFRAQAESRVGIRSTELRRQRKRGKRRIRNGNMMPVRPTLVAGGRAGAGATGPWRRRGQNALVALQETPALLRRARHWPLRPA